MAKKVKKGPYRKVVKVEILNDTKARKKGCVCEMHPVLAERLIAADKAEISTKDLTAVVHVGLPKPKVEKKDKE